LPVHRDSTVILLLFTESINRQLVILADKSTFPTEFKIKSPEEAISVSTPEILIEPLEILSVKSILLST
jgi:hypothetical protein